MKPIKISALLLLLQPIACSALGTQHSGRPAQPVPCADMVAHSLADTTVLSAAVVAAGAFEQPPANFAEFRPDYSRLPEFCRITGSIRPSADSDIRFELWLPTDNWNGKFMQTGNGGAAGSMLYFTMVEPLMRGYAVANTDTGHRGGGGDFSWVTGHAERLIDFQYRAVHELTRVGKALTGAHYGQAPRQSYFVGCSTGGRQGLVEAQRFPTDYDGIIASAPASDWLKLLALTVLIERNMSVGGLTPDKLVLLKEGALNACDARDGVRDRVIAEPGACDFDAGSLRCTEGRVSGCLAPREVAAARQLHAGLVSHDGDLLFPGTGPGSETGWAAFATPQFHIGSSYYRHVVRQDPDWDPESFDVDADLALAERLDGGATSALDPDLSAFIAGGGKLLLYHGTTDGLIPYRSSVDYYRNVVATLGEQVIGNSVRFYLVPGMDHCAGGEGAWLVDWVTALERWVENGETPGVLRGARPPAGFGPPGAAPGDPFMRPVCPYPQIARFSGSGDESAAASFECAAPR